MKTLFFLLCSIIWIPAAALAIEPVGTIGQPFAEKHTFLSDGTILRAGWTHLQIVHPETGAVIDEFGERNDISDVVFSPTADYLAILNYDVDSETTRVTIWDVALRQQISEWDVSARFFTGAFSPKGTLFATGFDDKIHLWNWQTGEWLGTMTGERRPWKQCNYTAGGGTCSFVRREHALVFTPSADYLIVASGRPEAELWNVKTRRLEAHFEGHRGNWIKKATISPNGEFLATIGHQSSCIYVWHLETQELLWWEESGIGDVSEAAFSPDSQRLYVATRTGALRSSGGETWEGWDDRVRVWNVASGHQLDSFGTEFRRLETLTLSPDGKTALLHYGDAIVLWDIEAKQQRKVWADFESGLYRPALSPDGQTLVSVSHYFIKVWALASGQLRQLISAEGGLFRMFAISPDGQKFAVGRDPWIQVYNLQTGDIETQFPYGHGHSNIAFSSTGRWVAARGYGEILLFDTENPGNIQRASREGEHETWFDEIAFSENDAYLIATDNEGQALLWKREGDTFVFQYGWDAQAFARGWERHAFGKVDGSTVFAVTGRENLQIWRLGQQNPELIATLLEVDSPAYFSADGRYLFAEQHDSLQIWEWQTNTPIVHPPIPRYFAVSQDGTVVLSYSETGQILIWDGKELLPPGAVAVEPRGKRTVTLGQVKQNQLLQNFPNPFNPETWLPFRLANESAVTIRIYAATGQLIRVLSPGILPSGDYSSQAQAVYWDGRNEIGEPVSSGVYLYTLHAGDFSATRKMLIRK